ncbi:MAG TPA: lipid A export permease/ATP-binding protein MsbA [Thiobacillus sp.]|nr:MAG: lipid A export permease/ATP-binding protein MsbA [Hydrogenophilales bacterium 28-61-11]OYZ57451.1 MAG: lipid A export permease/ATP-binding protein MsbA [Hydrogenophilales bacterium 16-61-112]OZA48264.1 MAG: lipid A export permease/ATP-binding protein MsbA [Hydrogenophilales bacterium 17-61-76]HQT29829.1 lipid A export permease/ATP-binding protein MsbA [Thiobacillus sp.]HQT69444.1 lipid A export permease/ATP-binding protein MsbA [Thiobacillus sp.]
MTPVPKSRVLYGRLLTYVKPYWRMFALSLVALILTAATEPMLPALFKPLLDQGFVAKDQAFIRWVPVLLLALFVVRGLTSFVSTYCMAWVGSRLVMDLRAAMFDKLMTLPTRYFDQNPSGQLIAQLAFNVTQVTQSATSSLTTLVRDTVTVLGLLGYLVWLNWRLTLIVFALVPLTLWVVRLASKRLRGLSRKAQQNIGDLTQVVDEAVGGHRVVKLYGGEAYEQDRFLSAANLARAYEMKRVAANAVYEPVIQFIAAIALAVIVYIAADQASDNATTVGGFVAFFMAMLLLFAPLKRLTAVNDQLQRGLAAAETIFSMLDQDAERDAGTQRFARIEGRLALRDVSLCYPGKTMPALHGIELDIAPGETVALVGASGSGKTTLANLVPRFYDPDSGVITLDGHDIRDIQLQNLRSHIALVSQDVTLFNDTLGHNIAYGTKRDATADEIRTACIAAHAWEFIQAMPDGLDTLIGENGMRLSGGQRQRIAIARAILKNAPILILDEATSALDNESERHVQAALETLMSNRTTLVIAHRLSTIERANRIVVLEGGHIVEIGSHAELIARQGRYAQLHALQFSA